MLFTIRPSFAIIEERIKYILARKSHRPKGGVQMRKYELMYIVKPSLDEEARTAVVEKAHAILTDNGATIDKVDEWGLRELAYEIEDFKKGYYVVTTFTSNDEAVNEFNRLTRINKDVLRHMIVRLDEKI